MHRLQLLFAILLLFSEASLAQTATADTQTLQNLVNEVHQLRQDLKSMATGMQRAQILFYRLQIQQTAVDRAIQRLDDARTKLEAAQSSRRDIAGVVKYMEDKEATAKTPAEQKDRADELSQAKLRLESLQSDEQEKQARVSECEERVRVEQATLTGLQEQLDQVDRALKVLDSR